MSRTLKINGTDYTSVWRQEESNFAARAHYGESVQSQFVIDDDEGSAVTHVDLASRKVVELWEDASGTNLCLWRGRMMNHTVGRGDKLMGDARQWQCNAEDYNIDLRGIRVVNSVRPAETDVARVLAFRAAYLNGTASSNVHHRASTTMGTAYVAAGGTVNLTAETYTDTFPDEVLRRIAEMSGKDYFVVVDTTDASAELFYDVATSTAFASDISITDAGTADGVNSFAPIYVSAPGSHEGQETLSGGGIRYNGGAGFYEESNIVSGETNHDKWEEHFTDDYVATEAEASTLLTRIVTARDNEHINFSVRLKMRDTQVHRIRSGMTLSVRLGAANLETAATLRAVQVILYPEGPGWYLVDVELGWPRDTPVVRTGRTRPPKAPQAAQQGDTVRFYFGSDSDITPTYATDAAWTGYLGSAPETRPLLRDRTATGWGSGGGSSNDSVNVAVGDYVDEQWTVTLTAAEAAIIAAGGTFRMQMRRRSRYGVGVGAQEDYAIIGARIFRAGVAMATIVTVGADRGTTAFPTDAGGVTTGLNRSQSGSFTAYASCAAGDVLVVEHGFHHVLPTGGGAGAGSYYNTSASDLPESDTAGTTDNAYNPWIEFRAPDTPASTGPSLGGPGEGDTGTQGTYLPADAVIEHGDLSGKGGTMHDAAQIELTDSGGLYTGTEVETALTEVVRKALIDAKGDLLVGTAADALARLAVGTDGQVLTADSAQSTGLKWETPSGGGGGSLTQAYVGKNAIGASQETMTTRRHYWKKITLANACLLTSIEGYITGNSNVVNLAVALAADNSNAPGNLLMGGQNPAGTWLHIGNGNAGWFGLPVGIWVPADDYWIAMVHVRGAGGVWTLAYDTSGSDQINTATGDWVHHGGGSTLSDSTRDYSIRANTIR